MKVVFLPLLFIFELIQQAGLVNFMLFLSILKILKMSFETFYRKIFEKTLRVTWKKNIVELQYLSREKSPMAMKIDSVELNS